MVLIALHIPTLSFLLLFFSLLFSAGLMLVQRDQPDAAALRWCAGAIALTGTAFLITLLRGVLPTVFTVVLSNGLLLLALCCFHEGVAHLRGRMGMDWRIGALLLLVQTALLVWFTVVEANLAARVMLVSLLQAPLILAVVWLLVRDLPPHLRNAHWFTAGAFLQFLAVTAMRTLDVLRTPPQDLMTGGPVQALSFLSLLVLVIMATFGCGWMVAARLAEELRHEARRDPLTQCLNRLGLEEALQRELDIAGRTGQPLSLILFDLDGFKGLNDRRGHPAGDRALCEVADAARRTLRGCDLLVRYGGDEFLALLPGADHEGARQVAERLDESIAALRLDSGDGRHLSGARGQSSYPEDGADGPTLIAKADQRLYAAKQARACTEA